MPSAPQTHGLVCQPCSASQTPFRFLSAVSKVSLPIHRDAPAFDEQSTEQEVLVTGIKVRDHAY